MKQQIVVLVGFLFLLAMAYPLITIFDREGLLLGFPMQAVYMFALWILAVLIMAVVIIRKRIKR